MAGKGMLSKNVLRMKFMQRGLDAETRKLLEEDEKKIISDDHWYLDLPELKAKQSLVLEERSFVPCEELLYGRMSFQGFNPEVEKLMVLMNPGVAPAATEQGEDDEMEVDVSDQEMARRYQSLVESGTCQPNGQRTRRPDHRSIEEPDHRPIEEPDHRSIKEPDHRSIEEPDHQRTRRDQRPIEQPDGQRTRRPDQQPIEQPDGQRTRWPDHRPIEKHDGQRTRQPDHQRTRRPDHQPIEQPDHQRTRRPDHRSIEQPDHQRTRQLDYQRSRQIDHGPIEQLDHQRYRHPDHRPIQLPDHEPDYQPDHDPDLEPVYQPARHPTRQPSRFLSPTDLFAARSRDHSLPQRSHGQKDFLPDHSEAQGEKLQQCRDEQWQLLLEERVERLGSLVRAEWKQLEDIVELTSPAGKFWHTMGFTSRGKQCLQPEEALYLLECGSIQLFDRDLPLSIQEAYERLLPSGPISLLQYQVFSHLKRLGFILMRFDPSTVLSPYERQLNMESSRHRSSDKGRCKRKRSLSPRSQDKKGKMGENVRDGEGTSETGAVSRGWLEEPCPGNGAEPGRYRNGAGHFHEVDCQLQARMADDCPAPQPAIPEGTNGVCRPRWDFTEIRFPNLGPDCPQTHLPEPDAALLPENVTGREVDVSRWIRRLNQKKERLTRREEEELEWERRYKDSVNSDAEVRRCGSWREYKELLRQRTQRGAQQRPPHLWNQEVTPLVQPDQVTSSASILEQIGILQTSHILDGATRLQEEEEVEGIRIDFDVYQADAAADFRKSNPGKPYARMCVRRFDEEIPDLRVLKQLTRQSGDVPVVFALVDNGDVAFYCFKDFQLPVDVYP